MSQDTPRFRNSISLETITTHLQERCSLTVVDVASVDQDVFTVTTKETDRPLVARIFCQPGVDGYIHDLAQLLTHLREHGFPAEECSELWPVSKFQDIDGCVMLTKFASGVAPPRNKETFYRLGKLMGKLHNIPIPDKLANHRAGGWHHVTLPGGITDECAAVLGMMEKFGTGKPDSENVRHISKLREALTEVHTACLDELPLSLVHPDLVPSNIIAEAGTGQYDKWTVVDWAGAGVGPRMPALGFLLAVAASRGTFGLVNIVMKGYMESGARLEPVELGQCLPICMYERILILRCWEVAMGRTEPEVVATELPSLLRTAQEVARRTREVATR